jgi:hypothetical protein
MSDPVVLIGLISNLFVRQMHFKNVGDSETSHMHQFDHMTLLAKGKLQITVDNQVSEFVAPHIIYINKDKIHELVAMSPDTVAYCIHPLRGPGQEDIIDPNMVPKGIELQQMLESLVVK